MCRNRLAVLVVVLFAGVAGPLKSHGDESLIRHLPTGALGTVEVAGVGPLLKQLETSDALAAYLKSPFYTEFQNSDPGRKSMMGKAVAEAQLGMDLWTFARTYLGGRIALGVYESPTGGQPEGVLVVQVEDDAALPKLLEKLTPLLVIAGDKIKLSDAEGGGKLLKLQDGNQAVIRSRWVVVSKSTELMSQTLNHLAAGTSSGLEGAPAWKGMAAQIGTNHTVQLCVNLARIAELKGGRLIPEKLDNPLVSLLLGGVLEMAVTSPYLAMTLDIQETGFKVQTAIGGKASELDEAHRALLVDPARPLIPLIPGISDRLGVISLTRDFVRWYKAREQLLESKVQPEFDKFETGLATFLPDKDFAEDVLPLLTGRIAFVSAPQDYAYLDGKPGVQLPAFGLVIELTRPSEGADLLNLVAQTILTITNLESSKQKRMPWVQSSESYKNVQINFARYLQRPKGDQLPTAYNFQPAAALVGNRFILSSSLGLCRQLVDALTADVRHEAAAVGRAEPVGIPNFVQELSPEIVAGLLEANAAVIHAKNIQNGKTAEQSQRELDAFCLLLRHLTPMRLDLVQYPDSVRLELHGGWK